MSLHGLTYWVALFLLCGGAGLTACAVLAIAEYVGKIRRRARRRIRLRLEQYRAEQAIRNIRREAICDLLEAERAHRYAYNDPGIIESTAIEVRRGE
jgi:hypothetical protein